ncbi:MAG: transcription elongation factor GreA [Spirochaetia bacterium]|nr:transcription elongation factor GreA [Spirochaetia bacterium]
MLKEETWTRAAIGSYTENNLRELSALVTKAEEEKCTKEVYDICNEQLSHSKDSIIALYFCGIIDLKNNSLDYSSLETLVDIFQKNHKENVVTYLCKNILADEPNNRFALRTLAASYEAENNPKAWDLYETLVKTDFTEADKAKLLAEHYESEGDQDKAVDYYKKAILRFIAANNYNACKEIWSKLVQYIPEEIDFFQMLRRKISKQMNEMKTTILMQELYTWYKDNKKWDIAIEILKQNLTVEPKDTWARKEIVDCFRGKYEGHSHLEDYIRSSNLTANYRNVFEAINDFEKHIAFDKGCFVFHRSWGVGIIRKLANDTLTINFGKAAGIKEMKLSMAVTALKPLAKDHIWVLKATKQKAELAEKIKKDKVWALKTIIKSYDNLCDFKKIKAELVPGILTAGEWTSWNSAAKKILESDAQFGVSPTDINMYTVRDHELSAEEKLSNEFKAQKQFFARVDILMKFFESDLTDKSSDFFAEMYSYFTGYLKNITKVNEQIITSWLIVNNITAIDKQFAVPSKDTFANLYNRIEDPREIYLSLKDSKQTHLRSDFLNAIRMLPDWDKQYIRLFPTALKEDMLTLLINEGHTDEVQKLVKTAFDQYKDYRETVLFFFEKCQDKEWYQNAGVSYEKQLITLINIIELTFREINNHVNSTDNKKINKNATALLFQESTLYAYMFSGDETLVKKMYTMIDDIADIDPSYKAQTRSKILDKYPDFKFRVSEEKDDQPKGMIVTAQKLAEKKAELERIQKVDIPQNAQDVAEAKAKGDLKENQEYKSAKEQQHFLSLQLAQLQSELNRAVVFDPTTSTTSMVSFGTVVTLTDNDSGKEETYTILGPWESDPDNNVISYMSPFGNAVLNRKAGETATFTINEHKYNYTVKEIKKASF